MGRLSTVPRHVLEAAWRAGLQGRRIVIPVRPDDDAKGAAIVRDLLKRAERRVVETGDARQRDIRQAWASVREEAARFGVAHSVVWRAMGEAEVWLLRWWREGEQARQRQLRGMTEASVAMEEYRRARWEIRHGEGDVAGLRPAVLIMAIHSVEAAWWGRRLVALPELMLAEEAAYLAVLMVDGRGSADRMARLAASRVGLPAGRVAELVRCVEQGVARAARTLARREQAA